MTPRIIFVCVAAIAPAISVAAAPSDDEWSGKGQVGLLFSQGNTEAKSANVAIDMARVDASWKHAFHVGNLYGQSGNVTSAQRWDAAWQSNYDLTPKVFTFGALRYARDKFSGFQYQATTAVGVGYKVIDSDVTKLTAQAGAGYKKLRPELISKNAAGSVISRTLLPSVGEAVLTAGVDFSHVLTDTTSLTNQLLMEYGSSNTLLTDTFALTVKMSDKLALSVGLSVQQNSAPPPGLKKRDTVQTVNVVFAF